MINVHKRFLWPSEQAEARPQQAFLNIVVEDAITKKGYTTNSRLTC